MQITKADLQGISKQELLKRATDYRKILADTPNTPEYIRDRVACKSMIRMYEESAVAAKE